VKPGGVVAFITSTGTLDKTDTKVRTMIAEKADLLGAIRLPNNAFKENAGTEVVSDIIFLQKREEPLNAEKDELPNWINTTVLREAHRNSDDGKWHDEIKRNNYFVENPHMIMGEYKEVSGRYGMTQTVFPIEGADLGEQLQKAMVNIVGSIPVREAPEMEMEPEISANALTLCPEDNIFKVGLDGEPYRDNANKLLSSDMFTDSSYAILHNTLYYRDGRHLEIIVQDILDFKNKLPKETEKQIKMVKIRDIVRSLLKEQLENSPDEEIKSLQRELNEAYDFFVLEQGRINSKENYSAFEKDNSYFLLSSLEKTNDDGEFIGKSDIFTKRTIKPDIEITSANTSVEALGASIGNTGNIDFVYMENLTGFSREKIINDLEGVIFLHKDREAAGDGWYISPDERYLPADEYLSGNVRKKLSEAKILAETDPRFAINVAALEKVQPKDLEAHEIAVNLGATWVDEHYIQEFVYETLDTYNMNRSSPYEKNKQREENYRICVRYSPVSNEWRITNKNKELNNVKVNMEYGTGRINAYHIIEQTLNLKHVVIKDRVQVRNAKGELVEVDVVNQEETTLARQKQEDLKNAFKEWIFKEPTRREFLVNKYNVKSNSIRPRKYDGSHIKFVGMNSEIKLEKHQIDAVARVLYGKNALLAHEVGTGKSFEMIASVMEAKRLGLSNKSLLVVPKHLTGQMASEFLRLYPNANILVATDKTFTKENRKKFCAKIATNNYDCVIMGHTQFKKIPLSPKRQMAFLEKEYNRLMKLIENMKRENGKGSFSVKQAENARHKIKTKLAKLYNDKNTDKNTVTFEELGIDMLFVDEADEFKNLAVYTKMQNVAGISQTESEKASDVYMKCRYLETLENHKGTIFATGTPLKNSIVEMYTMQRFLQEDTLIEMELGHFDQWAAQFTEITSDMELLPEGGGYRSRTRCAKFNNLPELMNTFFEVADIKTAESLNLPRPKANFHTISCEPSELQKEMVKGLGERANLVRKNVVDKEEDNMLKITNDGRKIGLDQRVINPNLPDNPDSKINHATQNIFNIWEKHQEAKLTQVVFCDLSTPSEKNKKEAGFNVYDDIKKKLIKKGVPGKEIAFIHDFKTDERKKQLFEKVRNGSIRVVFGSTGKMGAGTNIQDRLVALHHLDCPWRPGDLTQREGRIIRRGNQNKEVDIYRYVTKDTFDAYMYQIIEKKQQFISQIMTEKAPMRSMDDIDESVLNFAEVKALCVGNPKIKEKMNLEQDLKKLTILQNQYKRNVYSMEDAIIKKFPLQIKAKEQNIENYTSDKSRLDTNTAQTEEGGISPFKVNGRIYTKGIDAGQAIKLALQKIKTTEGDVVGSYRGFDIHLSFDKHSMNHKLALKGAMNYEIALESDFSTKGLVTRMDNALQKIDSQIKDEQEHLENIKKQLQTAEVEVKKPFAKEQEIKEKTQRLTALDIELDIDAQRSMRAEPEQNEQSKVSDVNENNNIVINSLKEQDIIFCSPEEIASATLTDNLVSYAQTSQHDPNTEITIYRTEAEITPGCFITTDIDLAKGYSENGVIFEKIVPAKDLIDDKNEPLMNEYLYIPENNQNRQQKEQNKDKTQEQPENKREQNREFTAFMKEKIAKHSDFNTILPEKPTKLADKKIDKKMSSVSL